jgi:rSAM/selenodomain-associated transferase 1
MADCAVLVFGRPCVSGQVKTRLIATLGAQGACELYRTMLRRSLRCVAELDVDRQLWLTSLGDDAESEAYARYLEFSCHAQTGTDLGARMQAALAAALVDYPLAILIGSDSPVLSAADIDRARVLLAGGRIEVVLTPAEDGGYLLIGMRRVHAALFGPGIAWGSDRVMADTRRRLASLDLRWRELAPRWDVDRPEDLARLNTLADQVPAAIRSS